MINLVLVITIWITAFIDFLYPFFFYLYIPAKSSFALFFSSIIFSNMILFRREYNCFWI